MFTGIVAETGTIAAIDPGTTSKRLIIKTALDLSDGKIGESISVNGCCLTVVEFTDKDIQVDVALESLKVTTLGELGVGAKVNLERALRLSDRLGGHWVQGHVDGVGRLLKRESHPEGELWQIEFPNDLRRYLVKKGSITVDGVSLTLNEVTDSHFEIFLIPHTLQVTNFAEKKLGERVNLEVDILGKYIETLLAERHSAD